MRSKQRFCNPLCELVHHYVNAYNLSQSDIILMLSAIKGTIRGILTNKGMI